MGGSPESPSAAIDFDHLAVAGEHEFDNFVRYYGELGGRIGVGGLDPGFHFSQIEFPTPQGRLAIEMLEPGNLEEDDFLRRFLDRNGAGPHHVTFKVRDLAGRLELVRAAGYEPVSVDLDDPTWKQAFLHPKRSHGVVVQLAQSDGEEPAVPDPEMLVPSKASSPAELRRVVLAVADLDAAVALFGVALDGAESGRGTDGDGRFVDLTWPGGGTLRLLAPDDPAVTAWVGSRLGRVHHVLFALDEPAGVRDARPVAEGLWEVPPEYNLGTRLRLLRR